MRLLIHRSGAFGDVLVTTPLIRHLHSQGHKIIYIANERGVQVLKNNPHIEKLIEQKTDSVPVKDLPEHLAWVQRKNHCDKIYDLSESIEVALSLHPRSPEYKLPKYEKIRRFNRNFYEYSFEFIKESWNGINLIPELFFDKHELEESQRHLKNNQINVLVGMSGSGTNKAWPWTEGFCHAICAKYPKVHIITVGDEKCRLIEPELPNRITNLSGKIPMRLSMALTGLVDCVISPDTGLLHASGCYKTPKIAILGHNTHEVITKYFENAYPVESDPTRCECSPCLSLIYNMKMQCPTVEEAGGAAMCMALGIPIEVVLKRFDEVYEKHLNK